MLTYESEKRIFTIHTKNTSYQMMADSRGVLLHLYYGRRISGAADYLLRLYDRGFSGNPYDAKEDRSYSLDVLPQEFPCLGTGDHRRPACILELENGASSCDLRYDSHEIRKGKYALPQLPAVYAGEEEAETLSITLKDAWGSGIEVTLLYGVIPEIDIITRSVQVTNRGSSGAALTRLLSANLDFLTGSFDVITFFGKHGMERVFQREAVSHGVKMIGSGRGMSSHQYNPLMILAEREATEESGCCYAMEFVYSGGFLAEAEQDPFEQTRMQMGLASERFHWPLAPGESFTAPEVILSCSTSGLAKLSQNLHSCLKQHVIRGKWRDEIRPFLLNSWEGCYFDFNGERILELAKGASELGLDMIVMDDGWFGSRRDDNAGLGDWTVNEEKLGCTLPELVAGIRDLGLAFGIWVEPEMVNEDSDFYRAHPDYALKVPGRNPVMARNQLVLDFSREEVVDAVYTQLASLLKSCPITYVKWDYNRCIEDVYSKGAADQGTVLHKYILGLYSLLERINREFPELLIEGCSGGGGRFDAGMLYYTPQIWCSDNTDAVDRLRIQHGTSFGYPVSAVGAHISVCPNHQCGRVTPLRTRGIVAMAGTYGLELDPGTLTEEEKEEIRRQLAVRRRFAALIEDGIYLRLSDPVRDPIAAWLMVSEDRSEALLSTVNLETHFNDAQRYVRLQGLDPGALYAVKDVFEESAAVLCPAAALMGSGFPIAREMGEYGAHMFYLKRQ